LKTFLVPTEVLALKGAADTILLTVAWTLPPNFAYVLNEMYLNIIVDKAFEWRDTGQYRLSQASSATAGASYRVPIEFALASNSATGTTLRMTRIRSGELPRTPIVTQVGGTTAVMAFTNENANAQAAGTVDAIISYWEYDLEQVQYYPIHSAANVLGR